jgi:hypothetical protein
MLDEMR